MVDIGECREIVEEIVFSLYLPNKWFYNFLPDTRKPV